MIAILQFKAGLARASATFAAAQPPSPNDTWSPHFARFRSLAEVESAITAIDGSFGYHQNEFFSYLPLLPLSVKVSSTLRLLLIPASSGSEYRVVT